MGTKLTPSELSILQSVLNACEYSRNKRVQMETIIRYAANEFQSNHKKIRKKVKKLVRKGYVIKHPSRGGMTYQITWMALEVGSDYCQV